MHTPRPTQPTAPHDARTDGSTDAAHASGPRADLAIEVEGLRCRYGDFEAVRGIDLRARQGELLAVLGTNGAGKTTTMEVLEGRRRGDGGRVRVLGRDPHSDRRTLAAHVGVVFQESALPDQLTPREFLQLWHRVAGDGQLVHRPADAQLDRVDLTHRRDMRIAALSGGERRRLDLAIALSADPQLLFLDEPTAGLDPESRADTWELLRGLLRMGTTVVLTTHHLEEAEALADHLAILHQGRVQVEGSRTELLGDEHESGRPSLAEVFHQVRHTSTTTEEPRR